MEMFKRTQRMNVKVRLGLLVRRYLDVNKTVTFNVVYGA